MDRLTPVSYTHLDVYKRQVLGCIADDFTGASDAASFLVKGGMSVLLYNGVPEEEELSLIHISMIVT